MNQDTRNAGMAAVLSFIFNGLGQLYNGQILKGLVIIFISSLAILVFIIGSILVGFWLSGNLFFSGQLAWGLILFFIGLVFMCILGVYSIIDAYKAASKKLV